MRLAIAESTDDLITILREGLDESGKTQKQLAGHMGFSTKHMNQILMGKAGLSLPHLFSILEYIGLDLAFLPVNRPRCAPYEVQRVHVLRSRGSSPVLPVTAATGPNPYSAGTRTLLARTCMSCGELADGDSFPVISGVGARRKTCHHCTNAKKKRDREERGIGVPTPRPPLELQTSKWQAWTAEEDTVPPGECRCHGL